MKKRRSEEKPFTELYAANSSNPKNFISNKKPKARNAANARERARMRVLSKAFSRLKTALPWVPPDTKLSKLDTLRLASSYIGHLRQLLDEENDVDKTLHPTSLIWPFTVHKASFEALQRRTYECKSFAELYKNGLISAPNCCSTPVFDQQ